MEPGEHFKGKSAIRCLLFDLGETLWTHKDKISEESVFQTREQAVAQLLQSYFASRDQRVRDYMHISGLLRTIMTQRYLHWRHLFYDCEPDPALIMTEACQILQFPQINRLQALTLFEAFRPPLRETRQVFEDTRETLHALQSHGLLLGCVTDRQYGGKAFLEDLQALGLREYFAPHAIIVSADCGKRKPHATPFLQATSALQVMPEETAMVGDFLSRDVVGAKKLNMLAIWKPKVHLLHEIERFEHSVNDQERKQKLLFSAWQQERETYPEMPFEELQPFMQPDIIIDRPSDLLSIFL